MKKFKNTKIQNITKPLALLLTTSLLIASVTACGKTTANTDATAETITDVSTEYESNSETSDKEDKKATTESTSEKDKTASTTEAESKNENATTPVVASAKQTASTEHRTVATTERRTAAPSAPTTEAPTPAPTPEQPKHEHTWTDVYKTVVDKEAYDEQVLVGYQQTQVYHKWAWMLKADTLEKIGKIDIQGTTWEYRRSVEEENGLSPMCLEGWWEEYEMVDDPTKPIYNTVHHDAVTHQELDYTYCTGCGKRK